MFIFSEPPEILPLTFGKETVDEGEFAQVICIVNKGDEPLVITWSLHGSVISSEPSVSTTLLGTRTSMLTIQTVGYRHTGHYTCTAKNRAGVVSGTTELKVNGGCFSLQAWGEVGEKWKGSQREHWNINLFSSSSVV